MLLTYKVRYICIINQIINKMINEPTQVTNTVVKRKKKNRLTDGEIAYIKEHAKKFDTIEERAFDLGIAINTYTDMMARIAFDETTAYCGFTTIDKLHEHMTANGYKF